MLLINFFALCIIFLLSTNHLLNGIKVDTNVVTTEFYGTFVAESFGMAANGIIEIDYNVVAQNLSTTYNGYTMILIITEDQRTAWYSSLNSQSCNQPSYLRRQIFGNGKLNFTIDSRIGSNLYSVVLLQCLTSEYNPIQINLNTQLLNPRPLGTGYSHMSINNVLEVRVYEGSLIMYCLLLLGLVLQLYFAKLVYLLYIICNFIGFIVLSILLNYCKIVIIQHENCF
jgi:hypothetical protein